MGNADSRQSIFFRARLKNWIPGSEAHGLKVGFVAQMIDNGFVFNGPNWGFAESSIQGLYFRPSVYRRVRGLADFEPWLARIVNFPEEVIDQAVKAIPPVWLEGEEEPLEVLLARLLKRRTRVPQFNNGFAPRPRESLSELGDKCPSIACPSRYCSFASLAAAQKFEVASVKPAVRDHDVSPNMRGGPGTADPERIIWEQLPLARLLSVVYDLSFEQISGPDWLGTDRFTIQVKLPPGTTKDQLKLMWQDLLAERFHLKAHFIKKDFPAYELSAPKGSRLRVAEGSPPPGQNWTYTVVPPRNAKFTFRSATIADLISQIKWPLSSMVRSNELVLGRVVDKTGLTGRYDFTLEFAGLRGPGGAFPRTLPEGVAETAPNLFDALWQQLGLKLEEKKTSLEVLVVDHVDRVPTEN